MTSEGLVLRKIDGMKEPPKRVFHRGRCRKLNFFKQLLAAERESHELKPLLDRWRRLNIARAPLTSRIEVLRKLRKYDPNCSAWAEMLREFEGYRLAEVESLVVQFQENSVEDEQAYQVAESLRKELSSQWVCVSPSDDLHQQLDQFLKESKKCHRRLVSEDSRRENFGGASRGRCALVKQIVREVGRICFDR